MWFTSDTHFNHDKIIKFGDADGNAIRPGFESIEQMNEALIARWNALVRPNDKIYHLGDFAMGDRSLLKPISTRLNGRKRLIVGNHDNIIDLCSRGIFEKVSAWRSFREHGFVCTHFPILMAENELGLTGNFLNVHGHIHEKPDPTPQHMNICVERTNLEPVHIDQILARVKQLKESHDDRPADVR